MTSPGTPQPPQPPRQPQAFPAARPPVLVLTSPAEIHVTPGAAGVVPVTVAWARADRADGPIGPSGATDLLIALVGLDGSWGAHAIAVPAPMGAAHVTTEVPLTPPFGTPAGRLDLVVSVQPVAADGRKVGEPAFADLTVVVGGTDGLLLEVRPAIPAGSTRRRIRVVLDNRSPNPLDLALSISTAPGLRAKLQHQRVVVPPRTTIRVKGRVRAGGGVTGPVRRLPFVVTAQGATTPARVNAAFEKRPMLAGAFTRGIALFVVIMLWVGIALLGLQALARHQKADADNPTATAVAAAQERANAAGGAATAGAAGGAEGAAAVQAAAAASAAKAAAAAVAAQGLRLNGTITGPGAGGAVITVASTTLVDEAAQGAPNVTAGQQPPGFVPAAYVAPAIGKVPAAEVAYQPQTVQGTTVSTHSQSDGTWSIPGIKAPGYYLVTLAEAGFQTQKFIITPTPGVDIPPIMVRLAPGPGQLSGRVLDADHHRGLGGAVVTISNGLTTVTTSSETKGTEIGYWHVDGLSTPSNYVVTATHAGFGSQATQVQLNVGATAASTGPVDLALAAGTTTITGVITSSDNNGNCPGSDGIGGATVTVASSTVTRTVTTATQPTTVAGGTDGTRPAELVCGGYVVSGLPIPGVYTVTVTGPGLVPQSERITLSQKPQGPLKLGLGSAVGGVTGTVVDRLTRQGLDPSGLVLTGPGGTFKTITSSSPVPGAFVLSGVPAGPYVLTATHFGYYTDSVSVTVASGLRSMKPTTVLLTAAPAGGLPQTASIVGSVLDARTGGAIATCDPDLATATQCLLTAKTSELRGNPALLTTIGDQRNPAEGYSLPDPAPSPGSPVVGLLPGLHTVTVNAPGYEPGSTTVTVPLGMQVTASPVALAPRAVITGTISVLTGAVPAGTCVTAQPATTPGADGTACSVASAGAKLVCTTGSGSTCAAVNADGSYIIKNLIHGAFVVRVIPPTTSAYLPVAPVTLQVGLSDTSRYDAQVHRLGQLRVVVQAPNAAGVLGPPGADATVTLTAADGTVIPSPGMSTTTPGLFTFPAIGASTYAVKGTAIVGAKTANRTLSQALSLDQTATLQMVLAAPVGDAIVGQGTVTSLIDNVATLRDCAIATITGTTGYDGTTAQVKTVKVATDATGTFTLVRDTASLPSVPSTCPDTSAAGAPAVPTAVVLPLVVSQVSIAVAPDTSPRGFQSLSVTGADLAGGSPYPLTVIPNPVPVSGLLTLVGAPTTSFTAATVQVISKAPGSGAVSVTVTPGTGSSTSLVWHDTAMTADGTAYPGTYVLRVSLPGYDDLQESVTILAPLDGTAFPLSAKLGGLAAATIQAACTNLPTDLPSVCDDVVGALPGLVVTVTAPGQQPRSYTAPSGVTKALFPSLSTLGLDGATQVVYSASVAVAGYAPASTTFTLTPGSTPTITVKLARLGSIAGTLTGRVSLDPAYPTVALPGVNVTAVNVTDGTTFTTVTGLDGTYTLAGTTNQQGLDAGMWSLSFGTPSGAAGSAPAGYLPQSLPAFLVSDGPATIRSTTFIALPVDLTATLTLTPGHLPTVATLKLTPPHGAIITAVAAVVGTDVDGGTATFTFSGPVSSTDPGGTTTNAALVPTNYLATVSGDNYGSVSTPITLSVGSASNSAQLTLGQLTNYVGGTVTVLPLAGVVVPVGQVVTISAVPNPTSGTPNFHDPAHPPITLAATQSTANPAQFSYSLPLIDGSWAIQATTSAATPTAAYVDAIDSPVRTVTLAYGITTSVDLSLAQYARAVAVTVTSPVAGTEDTLAGTSVTLTPMSGTAPGVSTQTVVAGLAPDNASGLATFNAVPSGTYKVTSTGPRGHRSATGSLTIDKYVVGSPAVTAVKAVSLAIGEFRVDATVQVSVQAGAALVTVSVVDPGGTVIGTETAVTDGSSSIPVYALLPTTVAGGGKTSTAAGAAACPGTCVPDFTALSVTAHSVGYTDASTTPQANGSEYVGTATLTPLLNPGINIGVTYANTSPVVGALVTLVPSGAYPTLTGTTGSGGQVNFTNGVYPGVSYEIHGDRFPTPYQSVTLNAGQAGVPKYITVTTLDPAPPSNVHAVGSATATTSATVTWTPNPNDGGGTLTGYVVTPNDVTPASAMVTTTGTVMPHTLTDPSLGSDTFTDLLPGHSYTFTVQTTSVDHSKVATDPGYQRISVASGPSDTVTVPSSKPSPPVLSSTVTETTATSVTLTWTMSTDGGSALTGYTVSGGSGFTPVSVSGGGTLTATVPVTPGKTYTFSVVANAADGTNSNPSNTVTHTVTPSDPSELTGGTVSVDSTTGNSVVEVLFDPPSDHSASKFLITSTYGDSITVNATGVSMVQDFSYPASVVGTNITYTVKSVAGTAPNKATSPGGTSSPVLVKGLPSRIDAPTVVGTAGSLAVAWTAPSSDGHSSITSYTITAVSSGDTKTMTVPATPPLATVLAVTGGASYKVSVYASNMFGNGPAGVQSGSVPASDPVPTAAPTTAAPTTAAPTTAAPTTAAPTTAAPTTAAPTTAAPTTAAPTTAAPTTAAPTTAAPTAAPTTTP